jgi:hypothetical protein
MVLTRAFNWPIGSKKIKNGAEDGSRTRNPRLGKPNESIFDYLAIPIMLAMTEFIFDVFLLFAYFSG